MDRLVIETEEDWAALREIVREQLRCELDLLKRGGYRVVRRIADVPGYINWVAMKQRCRDRRSDSWAHYGGRGIKVCERWKKFSNFIADMGLRPSKSHSIERINPDGDYEPGNCRWATKKEQARNTRVTVYATLGGQRKTLREWAENVGLNYTTIYNRMVLGGWSPEEAITMPLHGRWKRRVNDGGATVGEGASDRQGRERAAGDKANSGTGKSKR